MNKLIIIASLLFLSSCHWLMSDCKEEVIHDTVRITDTVYLDMMSREINIEPYINERLPRWLHESEVVNGIEICDSYTIDYRMNPLYLEEDFNGDKHIDIVLPVRNHLNNKLGFTIIHGFSHKVFIIGAGSNAVPQLPDDISYIDIWEVNRNKKNEPGVNETDVLILSNPSIQIEKSDVGGGQIYWDGKGYSYFHQTC